MKPGQLMIRFKFATLIALGLAFPASTEAQNVARASNSSNYTSSQVPRGDYRPKSGFQSAAPLRSSAPVVRSSAPVASRSHAAEVEPASCTSCQSGGVAHAHGHTATTVEDGGYYVEGNSYDADGYYAEDIPFQSRLRSPDAYRLQGGACGTDTCDPALGILGAILVHSQVRVAAATFWGDGQQVAPLLTTSVQNPIDLNTAGTLNDSLRRNLFGGSEMLDGGVQGFRGEIGLFTNGCRTGGLMLRMFDATNNSESYQSVPGTNGFIARPFVDGTAQETLVVNHGTQVVGTASASISSDVYGGDILLRRAFHQEQFARFEWLLGYQMVRLDEGLNIESNSGQNGVSAYVRDTFATSNRFHGAALGLNMHLSDNCWSFNTMLKLGIGNNDREIDIAGTSTFAGTSSSTSPNGLLARQSNAGHYTHSTLVAVPELELNLGYKITRWLATRS